MTKKIAWIVLYIMFFFSKSFQKIFVNIRMENPNYKKRYWEKILKQYEKEPFLKVKNSLKRYV